MSRQYLNVLLVGGGGRENALARALARSQRTRVLSAAPGNPGIAEICNCHPVAANDVDGLTKLASDLGTGLAVVGPEQPLVAGLTDSLQAYGIPVAGPTRAASRLEGSKVFAKETMTRLGIPQAEPYEIFDDFEAAESYLEACGHSVVVKADGLAAGKGVIVAADRGEAITAAREMLVEGRFGAAGRRIIVEPRLEGEEVSLLFVCDGHNAVPLVSARDYKRLEDGDRGPNTGGMGAHSPGSVDEALVDHVQETVVGPLLAGMAEERTFYKGILYCGLMLTSEGPKV
ncbi:MAG: phosphoribosylamine--glycine ligase, partial [Thermoanaerobaculia bacterium]